MDFPKPRKVTLRWRRIYRTVPSKHPPVNFFEKIVKPSQMEMAWYIEGLTNDRLRDAAGDVKLVTEQDRVSGAGASIVMAAFTHIGRPSRFGDGSFGIYYAAHDLETSIRETAYHRGRFLAATSEAPGEVDMRAYIGKVVKPMLDVRGTAYKELHDPDDYSRSQPFGKACREQGAWGIVYRSVRHEGGECIAALRPPAVSAPVPGPALAYVWDGERITSVYEKSQVLLTLA